MGPHGLIAIDIAIDIDSPACWHCAFFGIDIDIASDIHFDSAFDIDINIDTPACWFCLLVNLDIDIASDIAFDLAIDIDIDIDIDLQFIDIDCSLFICS